MVKEYAGQMTIDGRKYTIKDIESIANPKEGNKIEVNNSNNTQQNFITGFEIEFV